MKITCQACQAKYTIADEKVIGKVVKIRCKKCGATIMVNADERGTASSQPPGASSSPPSAKAAALEAYRAFLARSKAEGEKGDREAVAARVKVLE